MIKLNYKAFSLVEVIVASLVFALAVGGFFSALSTLQRPSTGLNDEESVKAAEFGKKVLEDLRKEVHAGTWNSGNLGIGSYRVTDGKYVAVYTVSNVNASATSPRKVDVRVTW